MSTAFNQLLSFDTSSVAVMYGMFDVRTARALPSTFTVGSSMRAAPSLHVTLFLSFLLTWQGAAAFNQPLSFDTSSVTTMEYMLKVCSARALPVASALGSTLRAACAAPAAPCSPASRPAWRPSSYASLCTRQNTAFNQPLSFDTSSVTAMDGMFQVRSRALPAASTVVSPCALLAPPPPPPPGPHVAPLLMRPFRLARFPMLPLRLGRARTRCPTQTRSSPVAHGRATLSLSLGTVQLGAAWARARRRRRHRRARPRRRPSLRMRRHNRRRPRRHPTPSRTRAP